LKDNFTDYPIKRVLGPPEDYGQNGRDLMGNKNAVCLFAEQTIPVVGYNDMNVMLCYDFINDPVFTQRGEH
jgi:hypothetical protein